jgi:hypothetical protein
MRRLFAGAALSAVMVATNQAGNRFPESIPGTVRQAQPSAAWRTFEGSWVVTGQQMVLPTERQLASVSQLSGAVALGATEGLTRAFRGQVITYDDGSGTVIGRATWTDHNDDRVFSTLKGDVLDAHRRVTATITGGTGAYAGITGDYSFEWQYVFTGDGPAVQGRAVNLRGRFRNGRQ